MVVTKGRLQLPVEEARISSAQPQSALLEKGGIVPAERNRGQRIEIGARRLGSEDVHVVVDERPS